MLTLTEEQLEGLIGQAREELVRTLIIEHRDGLELLTPVQVCGLLNINQKTLDELGAIPRVTIVPGRVIRYRACDLETYIESRRAPESLSPRKRKSRRSLA